MLVCISTERLKLSL